MKKLAIALTITLFAAALPISATHAAEKSPYGTLTVDPAGPNEIILTIAKGKKSTSFAYARLLKMKSKEITIYEPFMKRRERYTVIPIDRLFNLVGISGKDVVTTRALNDYVFKDRAERFITAGAYLAIKKNGQEIGYQEGGPIRLIYADSSNWAKYLDSWNWSLAAITVR